MGFELRSGVYLDAIRPVCVVTYGPTSIGNQVAASNWSGGTGGQAQRVLCPASSPIVIGLDATSSSYDNFVITNIHLYCGQAVPSQAMPAYPSATFDTPEHVIPAGVNSKLANNEDRTAYGHQGCPAGQVAVGVHGRAGTWVDAVGLICGAPRKDASGMALGRVQQTTPAPDISICERAQAARARNSPSAPALEAQCNASRQPAVPSGKVGVALGRVGAPAGTSGSVPVCDQAQSARARNSPVAAELEARCRAIGGGQGNPVELTPDQLAARGAILANDPLVAELRKRQPSANLRGFDIGMGAAEGQKEWGAGKEKVLASLNPAEQQGFKVAVSFTLDLNRNAQFAAIGAAIAQADPVVASARTRDPEVRAWLGFDIASGIYGDPAKGAKNNTFGLQSLAIRGQLSLPAQRGFDASKQLHLSRHY
jgi:hypothetical protein